VKPSLAVDSPTPSPPENHGGPPGRLVVISGAAGSGKSTLVHHLLARPGLRIRRSVSATTREPRSGEVHGVDYLFMTRPEFEAGRDQFLEWAEVHGHLYGTPLEGVRLALARGTCIVLVIDVQGAMNVRKLVPDALLIFIHAPDPQTLEARLRARGTDDESTILRRLANARREIAQAESYDYQIVNDDLDRAVNDLAAILAHHRCGG
jgi:guanylate kinase